MAPQTLQRIGKQAQRMAHDILSHDSLEEGGEQHRPVIGECAPVQLQVHAVQGWPVISICPGIVVRESILTREAGDSCTW